MGTLKFHVTISGDCIFSLHWNLKLNLRASVENPRPVEVTLAKIPLGQRTASLPEGEIGPAFVTDSAYYFLPFRAYPIPTFIHQLESIFQFSLGRNSSGQCYGLAFYFLKKPLPFSPYRYRQKLDILPTPQEVIPTQRPKLSLTECALFNHCLFCKCNQ